MADRNSRRTRRLLILLAGFAALVAAAGAAKLALDWRRDHRASQALARGMQAYEQGDYSRALPDLGRAAGRIRNDPDLLYAVADSRRRIPETNGRHINSAIAYARAARDADPDDPRPRLLLIDLYATASFITEMLDEADHILATDPANPNAHGARIAGQIALGRRDDALTSAEAALAANPTNIEFLQAMLEIIDASGRPHADLEATLAQHAPAFQGSPRFAALTGRVALLAEDTALATAQAHAALAANLSDPFALSEVVSLADSLAATDPTLFQKASDAIDAAMADPSVAPAVAAFVLERDWRLMQADAGRARAAALDPANPALPDEALGWAAMLAPQPAAARHEEALRARPHSPQRDAWLATLEASHALEIADLPAARAALDKLTAPPDRAGPQPATTPPAALAEARLLLSAGDTAAARTALARLGNERGWLIAKADLLFLLLSQNNLGDAMAVLEGTPLLATATAVPDAFAEAAASLVVTGQAGPLLAADVESFVGRIAQSAPDNANLQACHAITLLGLGRDQEAAAILANLDRQALPDNTRILLAAAAGQSLESAPDIDRLLASPPEDPDALLRAALVVAAGTDAATGRRLLDRATQAAPAARALPLAIVRAVYLDRTGDAEARAELLALAEDNPDSLPAQIALLDSAAAWTDPAGLDRAVARLRALTGEDKASWRIHEARRLLAFDPTEADTARAITLLNEARLTSWPNPTISDLLATAYLRDPGDPAARQRAVRLLVEGVQASADGAILYPRLVMLLRAAGDATEAAVHLDALLLRDSISPGLRLTRADLALVAGRYEDALRDYRSLARSGDPRARLGEANALVGLGSWPQAESIYAELAALPEPLPAVLLDYAGALAAHGHFDRGARALARLPERVEGQPRDLVIADYYSRYAPPDQAELHLRNLADSSDPELAPAGALRLARFYMQSGRSADALAAAEEHLQRHPDNTPLREIRALARLGASDNPAEDIAELARIASELDPDSTYARLVAAMLAHVNQTTSNAEYLLALEDLVRRDPVFLPTRAALVQAYIDDQRIPEAAAAAAQASDAVPENREAAAMAARTLAQAGQPLQAAVYIARWKSLLAPPSPEPDILSAALALDQGRAQEARVALAGWLDQLASQARETRAYRPLVAAILALDGRAQEAHALFPGDQLAPDDQPDYFTAAALMAPSSADAASAWYSAALPRLPATRDRLQLASILLELGVARRHTPSLEASRDILVAIDPADPDAADATSMLASARALLDDTEQAIAGYRQALARNPEDLLAMNNLAMLLSRSPDTAPEAVIHARSALALAERLQLPPDVFANILDTCGIALLASGDAPAALAAFRRGLELSPTNPGCQIGIAESLLAQGDQAGARAALSRVNPAAAEADEETRVRLERVRAAAQ